MARGDGIMAKAVRVLEAYQWDGTGDLDQAMAELGAAVLNERARVREAVRAVRANRAKPRQLPEWEQRAKEATDA